MLCLQAAVQIEKLYELFIARDATQVEVNPLGETDDGRGKYLNTLAFVIWLRFCIYSLSYLFAESSDDDILILFCTLCNAYSCMF